MKKVLKILDIFFLFLCKKRIFTYLKWCIVVLLIFFAILSFFSEKIEDIALIKKLTTVLAITETFLSASDTKIINDYVKNKEKVNELEMQIERIKLYEENIDCIFKNWLLFSLKRMEMDKNTRASLYLFEENFGKESDLFRFIARESLTPENKKKGRVFFKTQQGVIGKAWQEEFHFFYFPKNKTEQDYTDCMMAKYGYSLDEICRLTMKAKTILGGTICNENGYKIGVLVIETTVFFAKKNRKALEIKFRDVTKQMSQFLCPVLERYSNIVLNQEDK